MGTANARNKRSSDNPSLTGDSTVDNALWQLSLVLKEISEWGDEVNGEKEPPLLPRFKEDILLCKTQQ